MKTNRALINNIKRVVDERVEKISGEQSTSSTVTVGSTAGSVAGISDSAMLSNVLEYVGELIPEHFKGTGGDIVANDPPNMSVLITAFGDNSGVIAGGKLHTFIQDKIIKFSDVQGKDSVWYIQVDGSRVYRSQVRNRRHGCLGKVIITNKAERIVNDAPWLKNYSRREDEYNSTLYDGYIVSAKDLLFDDEAFRFDDPFKSQLKNYLDELLAENLIGTIRLHEGLTISNTQGTMNMDSRKVQFTTTSGSVLSEYGAELAYVGNIEIHPTAIQSRNFNSGSSGFQIRDKGDAEFNNVTVRGTIYATLGDIGGWDITSTTIESSGDEIVLDSSNLKITINDTTFGNEGIQLDYNGGSPRLYVGDGADEYMQYDTYLHVKGTIYATAGFFGADSNVISVANDGLNIGGSGNIRGGQTAFNTGTGFWLGYDTTAYKFSVGNPSGNYFSFDGTDVSVKGNIYATAGFFGSGSTVVSVDSGGLTVGITGSIKGGQTDYDTGTGFWMGYDGGAYKFSIGNASGNKIIWDGSSLSITGSITADTGTIGGWDITSTEIKSIVTGTAGLLLDSSVPNIAVNDGTRDRVYIGKNGSDYGIEVYDASGNVIFESSGAVDTLSGWDLTDSYFSKNNVKIDSAGIISVGGTTFGTAGVQLYYNAVDARGQFYAGDGSNKYVRYDYDDGLTWKGPNTELDASGNLTCSGGTIGGFTLSSTQIYNSTNIVLDASSKYIAIKDTTFGNDGIQLQYNAGNPRAYIGNGSTKYFKFDGTDITWDGGNSSMDASGNLTCSGGTIGGFTVGATSLSAGDIELDALFNVITVNTITIDGGNNRIRSSNYVSGTNGSGFTLEPNLLEVGNISARGILRTAVFQKDVISAVGGSVAILDADVLDSDMTAADSSTLTIEGNTTWSAGDHLRIKDGTDDEWLTIVSAASAPTYTLTRDRAGDYSLNANPAWKKGATVVNYGQSGDGGLFFTSSETNAPYLQVFTHAGSPWSAITTKVRLGNLNGSYGYSSDTFGLAMGETGGTNVTIDATNGFRIRSNTTNKFVIDASGNLTATGTIQTGASGNDRIVLDPTYGALFIYDSANNLNGYIGGGSGITTQAIVQIAGSTNNFILDLNGDDGQIYANEVQFLYTNENSASITMHSTTNADIFRVNGNGVYSDSGFFVGSIGDSTHIDDSTHGSSSTTMYIGDETIDTTAVSDARMKTVLHPIYNSLSLLSDLNVVAFNYNNDEENEKHYGMVAQEVEKIFPYAVYTRSDGMKAIDYKRFIPLIIQALQELNEIK